MGYHIIEMVKAIIFSDQNNMNFQNPIYLNPCSYKNKLIDIIITYLILVGRLALLQLTIYVKLQPS